ncbi:Lmx1 LIM homeobox protein [Elysia marginata]|uniref:Lmx1 LIM homeobox protein n=1 Tax=Elysia marginata TaxID=1093978 RepID=A0AAV4F5L8_9GAST|nr:Lmx1 LIM homeobox protein [Elysia marginata]
MMSMMGIPTSKIQSHVAVFTLKGDDTLKSTMGGREQGVPVLTNTTTPPSSNGGGPGCGTPVSAPCGGREVCAGCGAPIADRYLLKVLDESWHEACLQCSLCRVPLSGSCFSRDRKLYCRHDYDNSLQLTLNSSHTHKLKHRPYTAIFVFSLRLATNDSILAPGLANDFRTDSNKSSPDSPSELNLTDAPRL